MKKILMLSLAAALFGLTGVAQAQSNYPNRPIRMILPYPPGGSADEMARIIQSRLQPALGQPLVIENKGGAATAIGAQFVAQAPADGYTLLLSATPTSTNDILTKNLPYKMSDFAPVAGIAKTVNVVSVYKTLPVKDFKELVAYAKANPGKLNFASSGIGGLLHLMTEKLMSSTGTQMTHIPYQGAGPAWIDYIAGRIDVYFDSALASIPQANNGHIKILAVGNDERLSALPDVPTLKELGYPISAYAWYGIHAPKGTPQPIIDRWNAEVNKVVSSPEMLAFLKSVGGAPVTGNPAAFDKFVADDHQYWADIVKPLNIQMN